MRYEDARALDGKRVNWKWSKGTPPFDSGGVGLVVMVDHQYVTLSLTGLRPGRGAFTEAKRFRLDEIEMEAIL